MNTLQKSCAPPSLPSPDSHWREWLAYGLSWASAIMPTRAPWQAPAVDPGRTMTLHSYREAEPGPRWQALYDATWPGYRSWYTREGLAARPSLDECRAKLSEHLPELVPTWERLCELSGNDPVAARMLSMWRLPAFAVGCSQVVLPGEKPFWFATTTTTRRSSRPSSRPPTTPETAGCSVPVTCSGDCWTG